MEHFLTRIGGRCTLAIGLALGSGGIGTCGCFVAVDGKLERLARETGFQGQPAVSRNGPGTKLFLTGRAADNSTMIQAVSRDGVVPVVKGFSSGRPVLNDDDRLVAWVTNLQTGASTPGVVKALAFATGEAIPIVFTNAPPATFEFAPGGQYFLLDEPQKAVAMLGWAPVDQPVAFLTPRATNLEGSTTRWQVVVRTSFPTKPLFRLPNDFSGSNLFTRGKEVVVFGFKVVFGTDFKPRRPDLERDKAWAVVFGQEGFSYKLNRQLDLSRFSGVIDVDPVSGILLVRGKGEMFADWGLFDPETAKYKSLGHAGAHGFFLDPEFSKYLESRSN